MECYKYYDAVEFKGKTLKSVTVHGTDEIAFMFSDGSEYKMFHDQDCCEYVFIHEIIGDWSEIIGKTLDSSEESTHGTPDGIDTTDLYLDDSFTWTTYIFAAGDKKVVVRWLGTSNGYYSESVQIKKTKLANQ
jgi:hypothetical protein